MKTLKHTIEITEVHDEDGVRLDLVFIPSSDLMEGQYTPGYLIGAGTLKAFQRGDLESLVEKYLNEARK